jgi:hypothetical protein
VSASRIARSSRRSWSRSSVRSKRARALPSDTDPGTLPTVSAGVNL